MRSSINAARIPRGDRQNGVQAVRPRLGGPHDEHSRDHHWGRVFTEQREEILQMLGANMPETFQGRELGKSAREGARG